MGLNDGFTSPLRGVWRTLLRLLRAGLQARTSRWQVTPERERPRTPPPHMPPH